MGAVLCGDDSQKEAFSVAVTANRRLDIVMKNVRMFIGVTDFLFL